MSFVEDIVSEEELSNHGDIPENGGPDEVAAVAEVKPKKKRIRQNAKRRMAKRAAREAEEARQTEEAGPEEKGEAEGEAKEGAGLAEEGEAEEVEPEPNDTPNADLGGAMEAAKKKPRRRQRKHKPKVKDTTQNEIDHEPEKLAEPSEHH